jgi:hypothetical protein
MPFALSVAVHPSVVGPAWLKQVDMGTARLVQFEYHSFVGP